VMRLKLVPINLKIRGELEWLHTFIRKYHSSPAWILPSRKDLLNPSYHYFRAVAVSPVKLRNQVIGMSGYEVRTQFLVETQRTILHPDYRGQGWGAILSHEVEKLVRKKKFRKIRSTIYCDNLAMISIKLAQGFRIEGYHPDHDGPGLDEYSLGKILRQRR
jgi:RimJ/RimL family protein N-acetyltransferase